MGVWKEEGRSRDEQRNVEDGREGKRQREVCGKSER